MESLITVGLVAAGLAAVLIVQVLLSRRRRAGEEKVLRGYFLLGLSGLMAKIAMADGKVTGDEAALADGFFRRMKLNDAERALLIGNFITSRRDGLGARDHANRFMAYANSVACEFLYDLLWRISRADGVVDPAEDALLKDVARYLGLDAEAYGFFRNGGVRRYDRGMLRKCGVPESLVELT